LEEEWRDQKALQIVNEFETEFLEEQTAREVGLTRNYDTHFTLVHEEEVSDALNSFNFPLSASALQANLPSRCPPL